MKNHMKYHMKIGGGWAGGAGLFVVASGAVPGRLRGGLFIICTLLLLFREMSTIPRARKKGRSSFVDLFS